MSHTISPQAAMVYILIMTSAVDGDMDEQELEKIGNLRKELPLFKDFSTESFLTAARDCRAIVEDEESGMDTALGLIAESLTGALAEAGYALAVEVTMTNLQNEPEEMRFLELLGDHLGIDKLIRAALERGIRARFVTDWRGL